MAILAHSGAPQLPSQSRSDLRLDGSSPMECGVMTLDSGSCWLWIGRRSMLFLIDNMDVVIARWEEYDGGIGSYSRGR